MLPPLGTLVAPEHCPEILFLLCFRRFSFSINTLHLPSCTLFEYQLRHTHVDLDPLLVSSSCLTSSCLFGTNSSHPDTSSWFSPRCSLSWSSSELAPCSDAPTQPLLTSGTQTATRAQHISWGQVPRPSELRVSGVSARSPIRVLTVTLRQVRCRCYARHSIVSK